jgi:hypothetical protein
MYPVETNWLRVTAQTEHCDTQQFIPGCNIDETAPSKEEKKATASPQTTAKE